MHITKSVRGVFILPLRYKHVRFLDRIYFYSLQISSGRWSRERANIAQSCSPNNFWLAIHIICVGYICVKCEQIYHRITGRRQIINGHAAATLASYVDELRACLRGMGMFSVFKVCNKVMSWRKRSERWFEKERREHQHQLLPFHTVQCGIACFVWGHRASCPAGGKLKDSGEKFWEGWNERILVNGMRLGEKLNKIFKDKWRRIVGFIIKSTPKKLSTLSNRDLIYI